jgi:serine/threonine protein phosphatase PrpC
MQPNFLYDPEDDGDVSRKARLSFGDKIISVSAATLQGSKDGKTRKPNEDAFSVVSNNRRLFVAVFDGCSSQKSIDWLTDRTGARFASHFLKEQFEVLGPSLDPSGLLQKLNALLYRESASHQGASTQDVHSLPATTATIAVLDYDDNTLHVCHLGDTFCLVFYVDGSSKLVTIDKNERYDSEVFAQIAKIAKQKHITPREARHDLSINQAVKDMFQKTHNAPDGTGQGVINGDPVAEKYMQYEILPLAGINAILLGSDGLIPPGLDEHTETGRIQLLEVLKNGGVTALIKRKIEAENADPDWNHIRFKHSDDATGIYIKF